MPIRSRTKKRYISFALGILLFTVGFAIANRFQLTHYVLYRFAANDQVSAAENFLLLAGQALCLLMALMLCGRRLLFFLLPVLFVSILVNLGYGQTVNDLIDAGKLSWMFAEARQAGGAAGEFAFSLGLAAFQAIGAILCLYLAWLAFRRSALVPRRLICWPPALLALAAPNILAAFGALDTLTAERNVYALALEIARAEPPPPRAPVDMVPDASVDAPTDIVWLIDESVAARQFDELAPSLLEGHPHVDFGTAISMGHCSAPSNVAMRSGVDVRHARPTIDLRRTPSIWAYARKAGYRTVLIDGQTSGAPQNLLLPPERALIDEVMNVDDGMDTDRAIAARLNAMMKDDVKSFIYVILRGVHFQYRDHFPAGLIPADSSVMRQYETALNYSKRGFFDRLLDDVEREGVAIIYTSDHGQNIEEGVLPHCSRSPVADELRTPLIAFLPDRLSARYGEPITTARSASQIFPATLSWMGYDRQQAERRYDRDLDRPPFGYVWFDRNVIPLDSGDPVDVLVRDRPPAN